MNYKHLHAFILALLAGSLLFSCKSGIDLDNTDSSSEVEVGLGLPIGSIKLTVGDVFGDSSLFFVDSVDNKGVLTWRDTFTVSKDYHNMDLSQYFSTVEMGLKVKEKIKDQLSDIAQDLPGDTLYIMSPVDRKFVMEFPVDVPLVGINEDKTVSERLDKALIDNAYFVSVIRPEEFPFEWDMIKNIILDLGPRFKRPEGDSVYIYSKERGDNFGYGDSIPIIIDNFTLDMMKRSAEELYAEYGKHAYLQFAINNVYDTCSFTVKFEMLLPANKVLKISPNSALTYMLGVRFLDFSALWGMFEPSSEMSDEDVTDMGDKWGDLEFLARANLPFYNPRIDYNIRTQIAGALTIDDAYMFTLFTDDNHQESRDTAWAEFYGQRTKDFTFNDLGGVYMDPFTSNITDTAFFHMKFDNTRENGDIARLFKKVPQKLGYRFALDFNREQTPQIRIVPSTAVTIDAICTMPLILGQGVNVQYIDTMHDVQISQFSLDSLLSEMKSIDTLKTTDVKLYVKTSNTVPLGVKAVIHFLDENGNLIMDPDNDSVQVPMSIVDDPAHGDTLYLATPTYAREADGVMRMTEPGTSTVIASLTKAKLDQFAKVKHITYTAIIDDDGLQEAYKNGLQNIRITSEEFVSFRIGLTAHIDAILNFDKEKTNE